MENGAMECNPVLAGLMDGYGYGALMIMKVLGILFLVGIYIYKHISNDKYKTNHWNNVVKIFTLAGFILVVNNLYVISTLI